jgi:tetratricopeptide (TPR) repeat protein
MKRSHAITILFLFILTACTNNNDKPPKNMQHSLSPYLTDLYKQSNTFPDSIGLRITLINALDSSGMYKEAIQEMNYLIKKDSLNFGYWNTKAHLEENAKDTLQAIVSYKRALRVYPAPDAMLSLANLFAERKNDTALLLCNEVQNINPDKKYTADCKFISGIYFARIGNTQQALTLFDECINSRHTYIVAYLEKGFIYYDLKQYSDALKIFQLAATVSNAYADAYYWQAKCYESLNNKAEAINNYQKAISLDKNLKEAEAALQHLK